MKTIKELDAEIKELKQYAKEHEHSVTIMNDHIRAKAKKRALKEVVDVIDELIFDTINISRFELTGIIREDELKARIIGK